MITVTRLWPGITPWNIWDLPYGVWRGYAETTDMYLQKMREAERNG